MILKTLFGKQNRFAFFMAIMLLPLFFINVRDSHDWGGDFAMYIMQAENIVQGIPQSETPYIYNPDNAVLGPPAYPIGFPLILSPVYAIFGNSIFALTLWVTCFLFGLGLIMSVFLRRYFSDLLTFFLVMILIYNPWTLSMKLEIMSEFPFAFLLLLVVCLFEKYSKGPFWAGIIIAILGGLLISIRVIGFVFPLAVLVFAIRKRFIDKDKTPVTKCVCGFLVAVGSVLVYLLLNKLIFAVPQAEGSSYAGIWGHEKLYATLLLNLAYYAEQFKFFFSPWGGSWNFLPLILKAVIFTFTLLGMIKSFFRRLELADMIVILYFAILLIYPYRHAGIRFLFPVLPFLLIYLVRGLETVRIYQNIKKSVKVLFLGSLVLVSYLNMFSYILRTDHQVIQGPQEEVSIDAFEHISENTAEDAVVLFAKPRVLALYTGHRSLGNVKGSEPQEIAQLIMKNDVSYVLVQNEISDNAIKDFIYRQDGLCEYSWSNEKFVLYKVIK